MHLNLDPTQIITAWTAVIAVVSLVNKYALGPFAPNIARLISAVISIPTGHIANLIEDLQQLWKDINTPPPPVGPNASGGSSGSKPQPPILGRWKIGLALVMAFLGFNVGCSPAQQAIEAKVEQVVLDDLVAGKSLPQIEVDVAQLVAGQPGADTVVIVNDVLAFLIDVGVIPPNLLPRAQALLAEVKPVAEAHRATK